MVVLSAILKKALLLAVKVSAPALSPTAEKPSVFWSITW